MSYWTHIRGSIEVDVNGRTQAEIEYILKTVLEHLPRVQGSEGDMEIHIVKHDGHNSSTSCDEYGQHTNNLIDFRYGYKTNKNGWLQTQSNYTLTIIGDLRDKHFKETYKEFMRWLIRLSKRLFIQDVLIRITDSIKSTIIDDDFSQFYEYPSWSCGNENSEPAWWEHLCWNTYLDYALPETLIKKYYPEVFHSE